MKLNGLDLNKIHVFCSVVHHGGFRGASEDLSLTRSALSQSIASLEASLGVSLFQRVGTKLIPTEKALRFYEQARRYQHDLESSVHALIQEDGKIEGTLTIGAYLEFTKSKLMPVLQEFLNTHPKVRLKLIFDAPSRLEDLLESNRIDLSITIFPHRGVKAIESRKLFQQELLLLGRSDWVPEKVRVDELQKFPVIDYYPSHLLFKRWWSLHFGRKPMNNRVRSFVSTADMVFEMVRSRLGIGVVPRYLHENLENLDGREGVLRIIQPTPKRLLDYMWINQYRNARRAPVHEAFHQKLFKSFQHWHV